MEGNSKSKQRFFAPQSLPPEVWLRVHRWATFVPNALDTDAPDPFSYPSPLSQDEIQDALRRSLRTKRALVLVCKLWKELSLRFLYEAVYVGLTTTIWKLLQEAVVGPTTKRVKDALLWTKRLDYAIQDTSKKNMEDAFLNIALFLHTFMPNLEIFVARKTDVQSVLMQRLFANFCLSAQSKVTTFDSTHHLYDGAESGQRFVWTPVLVPQYKFENWETSPSDDSNHWCVALHYFHSVRHLHVRPNLIFPDVVHKIRDLTNPIRTPHLQYLVFNDWFPYRVDVENQDDIGLPFHLAYWGALAGLKGFLVRSPGLPSRLTTFECGRTDEMDIPGLLDVVAEHCPNLHNVILTVPTWDALVKAFPSTTLPRTAQRLGIRGFREVGRRPLMRQLCDHLCRVTETSTSLRIVRFMGRQATRNLREVNLPIARQMKKRMDDQKILLEAFDGRPLLQ